MINEDFYPTPKAVVHKMIEPFNRGINKRYILEPSAGSGNILDVITSLTIGVDKKRIYCIEQDPELTYVLQQKGYKLVGNDFLDYKPQYMFDLILMNPPFSNGAEHLLHAWDILESGDIVCLLNAETILNPYTQSRDLLAKVIEDNGSVEMLGPCFSDSERKTNVNIALVRLHKKGRIGLNLEFEPTEKESHFDFTEEAVTGNEVALNDKLGAYLRIYEKSKEAFAEYVKARAKLNYYAGEFLEQKGIDNLIINAEKEGKSDKVSIYNTFVDELKRNAWSSIILKLGLERYMTSSVQKNFDQFKSAQSSFDLTRENIRQLILMLCSSGDQILKQAVVDVFDIFTAYYNENRCYVEGWKTNSAWKVNRKVILPNFVSLGYGSYFTTNHYRWQEYSDIDRAMCYLSGKRYEDFNELAEPCSPFAHERERKYKMLSLQKSISRVPIGDSSEHESEFFKFRCYKKGTLHIYFKDEALWAKFNITACDGKFAVGYNSK